MTFNFRRRAVYAFVLSTLACGAETPSTPDEVTGQAPIGTPYLVKDLTPGPDPAYPSRSRMVDADGRVLFFTREDGVSTLWRSDGTAAGTVPVVRSTESLGLRWEGDTFEWVAPYAYFLASDPDHGLELWRSDGTPHGTALVTDMVPGPHAPGLSKFGRLGNRLFFARLTARESPGGAHWSRWELMRSDGTAAGTGVVKDFGEQYVRSFKTSIGAGREIRGRLFFALDDELWGSDGTPDGTVRLGSRLLVYRSFGEVEFAGNDRGLFFLSGVDSTNALWSSDGTPGGSAIVRRLGDSAPHWLRAARSRLFFGAGDVLWTSDGTPEHTGPIASFTGQVIFPLAALGDTLYFGVGEEIWRSDGSPAGTQRVAGLSGGSSGVEINGRLYFVANDGLHGRELWMTDGTADGTTLVADIRPGPEGSFDSVPGFTVSGARLFFWANDGQAGRALWALPLRGAR